VKRLKPPADYVGIDQIDDYSRDAEARKGTPYSALVVAQFGIEKAATAAAAKIRTGVTKSSVLNIASKQFHLHLEFGPLRVAAFEDADSPPNKAVAQCEALGGRVHANQ
jgi:hypothetical protein